MRIQINRLNAISPRAFAVGMAINLMVLLATVVVSWWATEQGKSSYGAGWVGVVAIFGFIACMTLRDLALTREDEERRLAKPEPLLNTIDLTIDKEWDEFNQNLERSMRNHPATLHKEPDIQWLKPYIDSIGGTDPNVFDCKVPQTFYPIQRAA